VPTPLDGQAAIHKQLKARTMAKPKREKINLNLDLSPLNPKREKIDLKLFDDVKLGRTKSA
jgi:hypothetical protein